MAIPGIFASDAGPVGGRSPDVLANTMLVTSNNEMAPFYSLTAGMNSQQATDTTVSWTENQSIDYTSWVTSVCGDPSGTKFEVSNPEMLDCNTILYHACSGELAMVTAVEGCTVHVRRGFGCTAKTQLKEGDAWERITTAFEEGSKPPKGFVGGGTQATNIMGIQRSTFQATGTALATAYSYGDLRAWMQRQTASRHARDKELGLFFSRRATGVINKMPFRTYAGIDEQIKQNRFISPPCGTDRHFLSAFMERLYSQNIEGQPNERIFMGSSGVLTALNEIGWRCTSQTLEYPVAENNGRAKFKFGVTFNEFDCPFGKLKLFIHPHFNGPAWKGRLYAIHPGSVSMRHLRNRLNIIQSDGTSQESNGSSSGLCDASMTVMTSEYTIALMQQAVNGVVDCITPAYATLA